MTRIESFEPADLPAIVTFVSALQEYERMLVPELKPGTEIAWDYVARLLQRVREHNGVMLLAKTEGTAVGFVCAWPERDDDPLLTDDGRAYGYISDIFVIESWRRRGVAQLLLQATEAALRERGCRRLRICSKAGNAVALACYEAAGFRPYEIILAKPLT